MDDTLWIDLPDRRNTADTSDFAALFAELDSPARGASLQGGLHRLLSAVEVLRRTADEGRRH